MPTDLNRLISFYRASSSFDDLLFLTLVLVGFNQLLCLSELCVPDDVRLFDIRRIMKRHQVSISLHTIRLLLPGHKADRFFTGSTLLICNSNISISPFPFLLRYIKKRDTLFPWLPSLWIRSNGSLPTRSWFLRQLHHHFPPSISGHSMRAGGATALAAQGVPDDRIRILGRWSSDAYQLYLRQHVHIVTARLYQSTS